MDSEDRPPKPPRGRTWVLDTETKGTGAQMVPLDKVVRSPADEPKRIFVPPKRRERPPEEPEPRRPPEFKVVDVVSGQVLAENASARATVDLLKTQRSVVDVRVYTREHGDDDTWRLLTLHEQRALWELRDR
jgi:hypothetical protein